MNAVVLIPVLVFAGLALFLLERRDLLEHLRPVAPYMGLFGFMVGLVLLALYLWMGSAMALRRLRDIGLPAVPLVAGGLALSLILKLAPLSPWTLVWPVAVLGWGVPAFLLLWPGRGVEPAAEVAETFA
jgi:uncharacterized membrane protein YhaH (DUF805 family)